MTEMTNKTDTGSGDNSPSQRVILDSSTPSARIIVRVVLITLAIIFLAESLRDILSSLGHFFFLIVISIFFAYVIEPLVRLVRKPFEERNLEKLMPRPLAIFVSFLAVFLILGIAISYLAPVVVEQGKRFWANFPAYTTYVQTQIRDLNQNFERYKIPDQVQDQVSGRASEFITQAGTAVTAFLISLAGYLPWLILVPVLSFFFLKDAKTLRNSFLRFFPSGNWRGRAESIVNDVNITLASYTRAQIISCLLIGTICTVIFSLAGVDYALLLGIAAGALEFIPLLGPFAIGVVAVSIAGFSGSLSQAIWVAALLIVLRIIHDYFTYPRIIRGGIDIHPLLIILSVLAGEQLAGIPGVFMAVPCIALITVLYKHLVEVRGRANVFPPNDSKAKATSELNETSDIALD